MQRQQHPPQTKASTTSSALAKASALHQHQHREHDPAPLITCASCPGTSNDRGVHRNSDCSGAKTWASSAPSNVISTHNARKSPVPRAPITVQDVTHPPWCPVHSHTRVFCPGTTSLSTSRTCTSSSDGSDPWLVGSCFPLRVASSRTTWTKRGVGVGENDVLGFDPSCDATSFDPTCDVIGGARAAFRRASMSQYTLRAQARAVRRTRLFMCVCLFSMQVRSDAAVVIRNF